MKNFVTSLLQNNSFEAKNILNNRVRELIDEKLGQIKLRLVSETFGDVSAVVDFINESPTVTRYGRTKLVRVRVRQGKIQRRKKFSAVKGYTIRGGKLVRISPSEHRHRIVAARRAKFKRRAKMSNALRKRQRSLRRRRTLGL